MAPDPTPRPPADILDLLETSIVHTYVKSLLFLGFAIDRQESKSRIVSASFKMDKMESYIESLQESGYQLSRAADNCEKQCSLQNRTGVEELLSYAKESHHIMQAHSVLLMDIHQRMVFDRLRTAEGAAYDSYDNDNARCHPRTRLDLLADIYEWAGDPDSECIYWLQGMAGTGKSTISRTVAHKLARQEVLGASFFFKRGEGDRGKAARFITTIATQLVRRLPSLALHVQKAIETDPDIGEKAISKQFNSLVKLPLEKIESELQNPLTVVVVIDALDECKDEKEVGEILDQLSLARSLASTRLKFFVTSRPESTICSDFARIRHYWGHSLWKDAILHEVNTQTVERDITAFLESKLKKIRDDYSICYLEEQKLSENWPTRTDLQSLVKMAIPLFIFAETACKLIENGKPGNPEKNLRRILERATGSGTSSLDKLYRFVLEQLLDDPICPKEELLKEFQDIVGTIVTLANPLPAAYLAKVLGIDKETVFDMVRQLRSVLYVPSKKDTPIRPLHLSFRDFLINRDKHKTDQFWVDERETNKKLAVRCLQLLMNNNYLKKNICDLRTPGIARSDIDKGKIDERLPPEAQYACLYWVYHLKESHERVRDRDQAHEFLELHFLHWLEALSLIGRISESIGFIDELQSIVDPEKGARALSFLRDAKRFVLNYRWIIDIAPLQLYASAIVFAPKQSIVRQIFKHYIPRWITLLPNVDSNWNAVLQTLEGHTDSVNSVVFSNDGMLIASGSDDKTVKVWNVATGEEERTLEGHTSSVISVVFSNDGTLIASGSYDKTAKIWNIATGEEERTLEGHTSLVTSVVFSNDGKLIASGSYDGTVKIWNVATGEKGRTLEGPTGTVRSVAFSNDGTLIASVSYDRTVKIWNVAMGINLKSFDTRQFTNMLSFTDDDSVLITSVGRFSLGFRDISTSHSSESEPQLDSTEVQGEVDARLGFGINHDNTWITTGGPDGRKVLWLPPDFRPNILATSTEASRSVVIGCRLGRVVIMGFRPSSFLDGV